MKNPNFEALALVRTPTSTTYGIKNFEGMTKDEIINACDCCNWGGEVWGTFCKVYTD